MPKGKEAVAMRIAEQFVSRFGEIVDGAKMSVMPINVAQIRAFLQSVIPPNMNVQDSFNQEEKVDTSYGAELKGRSN